jgi:DNA invertase Pin-like site-specific DNA recombinase
MSTPTDLTTDYADVSNPAGEPVAIMERVSTDSTRQDFASQTTDLKTFIRAGSFRVVKVLRFEASAYKGKHEAQLSEIKADVAAGLYRTILAAMSSRYERRGAKAALRFALDLDDAGARVVAVDDAGYGDMSSEMGIIGTVLKAKSNFDYSNDISKNVSRKFREMDARGAWRGMPPAGYQVRGEKWGKYLEPHPVTGPEVTWAFSCLQSTPVISRRFRAVNAAHAIGTRVTPKGRIRPKYDDDYRPLPETADGVGKMLRNEAYATGKWPLPDGEHHHVADALVSPSQRNASLAALTARRTGDNVTSRAIPKDDFSGALRCAWDGGRMYRYFGGNRKRADGSRGPKVRRYACETCQRSVNAEVADRKVNARMAADSFLWVVPVPVDPGAERDRKILGLEDELEILGKTARTEGWSRAERRAREDSVYDQIDKLREFQPDPMWYRADVMTDSQGRSLTRGDQWEAMSPAERRDLLASGTVVFEVKAAPGRMGDVEVDASGEYFGDDQSGE